MGDSWKAPIRFFACIGTVNRFVLVLVLLLEAKPRDLDEDENDDEDERVVHEKPLRQ